MAHRRAQAAAGDLYQLVQRLLAHICERELHVLAVERGRALSKEADTPVSLALAAWSSAVSLCASGHYDEALGLPMLARRACDHCSKPAQLQLWGRMAHCSLRQPPRTAWPVGRVTPFAAWTLRR